LINIFEKPTSLTNCFNTKSIRSRRFYP